MGATYLFLGKKDAAREQFRLLLEAYQLEQDYGNRIESWRGPLALEGQELSVGFLRVGRVALYYQTLDG